MTKIKRNAWWWLPLLASGVVISLCMLIPAWSQTQVVGLSGGGVSADLSNLTDPTAINDTTLTFAGAGGLTAGGTNQNITFTPSGTGELLIHQAVGATAQFLDVQRSDNTSLMSITNAAGTNGLITFGGTAQFNRPVQISSDTLNFITTTNHAGFQDMNIQGDYGLSLVGGRGPAGGGNAVVTITPSGTAQIVASKNIQQSHVVDTYSATTAIDASIKQHEMTLTGDTIFTITNALEGDELVFLWIQDSGGLHVVTPPANFHGFTSPGTTASTYSRQTCDYDGTNWICGVANVNIP